jgi:predicted TPR repeat methyltransferase
MNQRKAIHDRVLNATSTEELMAAYGDWAEKYDGDLMGEMGYVAPMMTSELLLNTLPDNEARILDAGCGTGLVGELLYRKGYRNIDGLDYSPEMLAKAKEKSVYQRLDRQDLTQSLDIEDNVYDAVISVGTFTCGHVGPEAFEELVRITRPGGWVCFTVREQAWAEDKYRHRIEDMEGRGLWARQKLTAADYIRQEGARCKLGLYRISA